MPQLLAVMPPKANNNLQFSVADPDNEVVCPITQPDGTGCRKRCLGEKRFRSMQEHIRRAHPEYYIPKLPATKESFELMVNSPPHEIPQPVQQPQQDNWSPPSERREHHYLQQQQSAPSDSAGLSFAPAYDSFGDTSSFQQGNIPNDTYYADPIAAFERSSSVQYRRGSLLPAASAAAALAQLHYARPDGDWGGDHNFFADTVPDDNGPKFADPTLSAEQQFLDSQYQTMPLGNGNHTSDPFPQDLDKSPQARSSAPAVQRPLSRSARPRKSSVTKHARKPKHEKKTSKDYLRPTNHDRKAFSAEPNAAALYGKRWEDLIDAATSATEEDSRDLTPIPASPFQSPQNQARTPIAPFAIGAQFQSYTASPLQQALTPPPADPSSNLDLQPYPSVEEQSSIDSNASGTNFHIMPSAQATLSSASDSSPMFNTPVQIYCAGCRRLSVLKDSFACTECICGLCAGCVDALVSEQRRGRIAQCPRCRTMGGSFKTFQLDIR